MFLSETRRSAQRVMQLKWRLGLNHAFGVDSRGQSGGLVLFWHGDMELVLLGLSSRFIDARVKDRDSNQWSRITFVYGEPRVENRHLMWETLRRLCAVSALSWLVLGDLNEAMWGYEHFSASSRPERQMENFRDALSDCDLTDIGFCGVPYTYDNHRSGDANVRVRLDRVVADSNWRDLSAEAKVHHLVTPRSDYCPLLVELKKDCWDIKGPRIFRYEIIWERVNSLSAEIKRAWCSSADRESLGNLVSVLKNMQIALR
jgi:hypothetical protein